MVSDERNLIFIEQTFVVGFVVVVVVLWELMS